MLSQKRIDLIRKNLPKVALLSGKKHDECCYQYSDGSICIASAALTDEERQIVVDAGENDTMIDRPSILKHLPELTKEDALELRRLQCLHDKGMQSVPDCRRMLQKEVDKLLNT